MSVEPSTARLGWRYAGGRLACCVAVAGILWVLGVRNVWLLMGGAVLLSAPISFFALRSTRLAWGARLEEGFARRKAEKARLRAALRGDDEDEPTT